MIGLVVVVGLLVWAGATLLVDAWRRARHPSVPRRGLYERLASHQPAGLAEEVEAWLRSR
ncbi:MAG: hypothetical protein ACREOV_09905 [Candidatus Dormibacteraceae bacterium]